MNNQKFLKFLALGGFELSIIIFFGILSLICSVIEGDFSSCFYILKIVLILISIIISIWGFFTRRKAVCYLTASFTRMILFVLVIIMLQTFSTSKESGYSEYWIIASTLEALLVIGIGYSRFNAKWDNTVENWRKIRKINIKKQRFYVSAMNYQHREGELDNLKYIVPISIVGYLLLIFLANFLGVSFKLMMLRVVILGMIFLFGLVCATSGVWLINLRKMEKELNIEFLSEFADEAELPNIENKKSRKLK